MSQSRQYPTPTPMVGGSYSGWLMTGKPRWEHNPASADAKAAESNSLTVALRHQPHCPDDYPYTKFGYRFLWHLHRYNPRIYG